LKAPIAWPKYLSRGGEQVVYPHVVLSIEEGVVSSYNSLQTPWLTQFLNQNLGVLQGPARFKTPAWAQLGRARAYKNLEPDLGRPLGLGSAGLRLRPGLQSKQ